MKKIIRLVIILAVVILYIWWVSTGEPVENKSTNTIKKRTNVDANIVNFLTGDPEIDDIITNTAGAADMFNFKDSVLGEWKYDGATSLTGTDIDTSEFFGTGLKYGGLIKFNEDGTYTEQIGITSDDEKDMLNGTYVMDGSKIIMTSYSGIVQNGDKISSSIVRVEDKVYSGGKAYFYFMQDPEDQIIE